MKRNLYIGGIFLATFAALGIASTVVEKKAAVEASGVMAPSFEVDPLWPKPLPNHWLMGMTIGVSVDAQDHIWIIHRQGSLEAGELHATTNPPIAQCCAAGSAGPRIRSGRQPAFGTGVVPATATIGRSRTTESRSITKGTSGSAATAEVRSPSEAVGRHA